MRSARIGLVYAMVLQAGVAVSAAQSGDLQNALNKTLHKKELQGVHGTVQGTTAVLQGTVPVYDDKQEAGKRASDVHGITAVENEIQVDRGGVSDEELQRKVLAAVESDRIGYGSTPFNAISVQVHDGVVRLGGYAVGPVSADAAVSSASNVKGVQNVVNDIQVDPLSPMDNGIRIRVYRAVYGYPSLTKYAVDPVKPIRIQVANGQVTLFGTVDSKADKEAAGIRANSVPGVFHVTNDLQVQNGGNESGK